MAVLTIDNVVKRYGKKVAVDHISFEVNNDKIFGLLGPNGAGKTSLIRIITSITKPDSGTVSINGNEINLQSIKDIGYMPEERGLYKKMKVGDHLIYLGRLKGLDKNVAKKEVKAWMDKFDINDWWNKKIEELSKGMQQKVQFIATVIHKPKLLILDEPFSGLDPVNTNLIKDEIQELHEKGTSIIFSTHRMEQVEEICERIVLINDGIKVLEGDVMDIKDQFKEHLFSIKYKGVSPDLSQSEFKTLKHDQNEIIVRSSQDGNANQLLNYLVKQNTHIQSFKEILPSLNEIFIKQVSDK